VRESDRHAFAVALGQGATGTSRAARLCEACRARLAVSGVGISLTTGQHRGQLCVTDPVTAGLEELQYTLGEGPSLDASAGGHPVAEPDRRGPARWPAFAAAAAAAGIAAVSAFPLAVGAARIGSLTLYQALPGALEPDQRADALVAADLVTMQVVALQAGAAPGALADELEAAGLQRPQVHQASGMISVQLGVSLGEALIRLRSHAYAVDRPIAEVAAEVVARRLRLER
jgi:hypothetical protein